MKSQWNGSCAGKRYYAKDLLHAIASCLPKRGLSLQSDDHRVRWTPRLVVTVAILSGWAVSSTCREAFAIARGDSYRRSGSKQSRNYPRKKRKNPPAPPEYPHGDREGNSTCKGLQATFGGRLVHGVGCHPTNYRTASRCLQACLAALMHRMPANSAGMAPLANYS